MFDWCRYFLVRGAFSYDTHHSVGAGQGNDHIGRRDAHRAPSVKAQYLSPTFWELLSYNCDAKDFLDIHTGDSLPWRFSVCIRVPFQ